MNLEFSDGSDPKRICDWSRLWIARENRVVVFRMRQGIDHCKISLSPIRAEVLRTYLVSWLKRPRGREPFLYRRIRKKGGPMYTDWLQVGCTDDSVWITMGAWNGCGCIQLFRGAVSDLVRLLKG